MNTLITGLRRLDAYPKLKSEDTVRTTHGACLSIVALVTMFGLFCSEYSFYRTIDVQDRLSVNSTHGEHLKVSFDVVFPHIACGLLSLEALDQSGQKQEGVTHHVFKKKLPRVNGKVEVPAPKLGLDKGAKNRKGRPLKVNKVLQLDRGDKVTSLGTLQHEHELEAIHAESEAEAEAQCGNCYGAAAEDGDCCQTCESVRAAYVAKGWTFSADGVAQCAGEAVAKSLAGEVDEGCQLSGDIDLTTVHGNFHFAPHTATAFGSRNGLMTLQELLAATFQNFNVSHEVRKLSFGNHFPGITNPLDGQARAVEDGHGMYQYYVKVVPTVYQYLDGRRVASNQYSVTEHLRHVADGAGRGLPGVWFFYEVSPVHATFEETRRSFFEFASTVCGLLGGVFTIVGVMEGGVGALMKKFGKGSELAM